MTPDSISIEDTLVGLWQGLYGEAIDIDGGDSFFGLGGTSILAVRLVERIQQQFGVDFKLSWLLENPTLQGQARLIQDLLLDRDTGSVGIL